MQNPVFRLYQERLKAVLRQADTTILLNQSAPSSPRNTDYASHASSGSVSARSLTESDSEEAESLLESSHSESNLTIRKIQLDLSLQNYTASNRLDIRKKGTISPRNSDPNVNYARDLERVLEMYIKRKVEREAIIREQYRAQCQELGTANSTVVSRVLAEMRKAEEREICTLSEEIEAEKSQALQQLRAQYFH